MNKKPSLQNAANSLKQARRNRIVKVHRQSLVDSDPNAVGDHKSRSTVHRYYTGRSGPYDGRNASVGRRGGGAS